MKQTIRKTLLAATSSLLLINITFAQDDIALVSDGQTIDLLSDRVAEYGAFTLKIAAPDGRIWQEQYTGHTLAPINLAGVFEGDMPDGQYHYELLPHLGWAGDLGSPEQRGLDRQEHEQPNPQIGSFTVAQGSIIDPNALEEAPDSKPAHSLDSSMLQRQSGEDANLMTQVIDDELSVRGSLCAGLSCGNNEPFDMETIKLYENNTRISFIDSSSPSGNFPAGSWELRANDETEGGADHFSIDWLGEGVETGGSPLSTPFRIDGSAPTNSLRITSTGRIGLGTSTPGRNVHVASPNSPTIRLEQTTVGGFSPQSWDIAGNETSFYIRDITNANRIPFRISQGAPVRSLEIAEDGNVGFGTGSPQASIHVSSTNGNASILVEETTANATPRTLLRLANPGNTKLEVENTTTSQSWAFANPGNAFRLSLQDSGVVEFEIDPSGNLAIAGTLTQGSSETIKDNFSHIEPSQVLASITKLDFSSWSYRSAPASRHFGPMAEDFFSEFGFGKSNTHIAPGDMAGVAMAAAKALNEENNQLKSQVEALKDTLNDVEYRMVHLEKLLQ